MWFKFIYGHGILWIGNRPLTSAAFFFKLLYTGDIIKAIPLWSIPKDFIKSFCLKITSAILLLWHTVWQCRSNTFLFHNEEYRPTTRNRFEYPQMLKGQIVKVTSSFRVFQQQANLSVCDDLIDHAHRRVRRPISLFKSMCSPSQTKSRQLYNLKKSPKKYDH